jgi:uncharacterized Zn ribbon protein
MSNKYIGRQIVICNKCNSKFSTHSKNRNMCYHCKPKCKEIHWFPKQDQERALKDKKAKEGKES